MEQRRSVPIAAWLAVLACLTAAAVLGPARPVARVHADIAGVAGLLERGRYEEAEAAAGSAVAGLRRSRGESAADAAAASDLLVRALRLNGKAGAAETLWLAERVVRVKRMRHGDGHPETIVSLLNLGQVLTDRGDHGRAIAELQRALAIWERSGKSDDSQMADVLDALGVAFTRVRSYDEALAALDRSRQIRERLLPASSGALRRTLENAAAALQGKGDYPAARERLDRALAIRGAPLGSHTSDVATLNLLALQHWFEGDLLRSRDASRRAVQLAKETLRPDHPEVARALRVLAATIDDLGEMVESRTYREQALAIARRSLGDDHFELAAYLNDLGNLNLLLGSYTDARDQFQRALRIAEARLPARHDWIPMIVHNLALVDASLGDFAGAERQQARAVELWERALGPDHPFIAVALTELAAVLRDQGAPAQALPLLDRALAIRERALGPGHRDAGRTMADIAATLSQLGQHDRARMFASRALAIWDRPGSGDAPELATVLELSANLQIARGAPGEAMSFFERALAIRRRAFGPSHPSVAAVQANLAIALASVGRTQAAFDLALQAEASGRDHLRLTSRSLPERQALSYAANRPRALDLLLSLSVSGSAQFGSASFDALIRSRALVLDEMAARRRVSAGSGDALAPLRAQLVSAQQQLANLLVRGMDEQPTERYMKVLEEARRSAEDAERALAARSASFREERNQAHAGLSDVRASLPRDAALVSFVRFRSMATGGGRIAPQRPGRSDANDALVYLAIVMRAGREPAVVSLGSASAVEAVIARWRSAVASGATRDAAALAASAAALRDVGLALRAAVWDPVIPHLGDARLVFVVPDGALSLVPLAALPGRTHEFLLEETPVVHYLSAERDLAAAPLPPDNRGLLALGGADFGEPAPDRRGASLTTMPPQAGAAGCPGSGPVNFRPLAATVQEVTEIAALWTARAAAAGPVRVLAGAGAQERSFKGEASRYRVLHLATHGFFLGGACDAGGEESLRSVGGLVTAPRPGPGFGPAPAGQNPLVLSGLALAGANRRSAADTGEDDGILTAEEVASLNLEGTEWAVLSACDTGVGEIRAGEGVFGLRRAFRIAGARTIIMSLWPVDDRATRLWMRALYEGRLNMRLSTADAVRSAGFRVLAERRARGESTQPFYWAAFVAAGDWR